ncbi:PREDICTED: DNA topoisomerase 3-alpha-like [Nicotiana attenuata]|uniref:DNA topoisomerase 3-alpha-like n=1 Tax=Nicotiana attenuata TaxID=49451 RepID=UPI0009047668|nr:PREDICTED: DNA topoisomerase 3-alpha-like [Nicotiana attenuata]
MDSLMDMLARVEVFTIDENLPDTMKWGNKGIFTVKECYKHICPQNQDNLNRRGFQLVNRCYMCKESSENVSHMLLHCPVATDLWNMFFCLFGLNWVMPSYIREAYTSWSLWEVDKAIKEIWLMIPAVIFWSLWNERNQRCFGGISTPNHTLKANCLLTLFSWVKLTPLCQLTRMPMLLNCNIQATRMATKTMVQEQDGHPVWGSYAQRLLDPQSGLWRNPSGGGHDDKAHPPIHPTKFSAGESRWSQDHHRVYELVVRHFLACVSKPAVGAETTVEIDIAGESFFTCGRVILAKNYLDVYRFESWGGSVIPPYTFGQQFIPTSLTLDSGVTRPPPLLSEADLLGCMDKAGIGTDATMHDHIKKLLDRFYAIKDSSTRFSPTKLGEALVMGYDDMGYELWKPYLRAMMECDMKAVSMGTKRKTEVLETSLQQMKACFLDARANKGKLFEAMAIFFERSNRSSGGEQQAVGDVVRRCGLCLESDMVLRQKPDGNFMVGCLGYPQCRNVVWLPGSLSEASVMENTCTSCGPGPVYKIQFRFRRLEIPPNYSAHHIGCIGGCDDILRQLVEICGTGARSSSNTFENGTSIAVFFFFLENSRLPVGPLCAKAVLSCPTSLILSNNAGEPSIPCNSCGAPCNLRTANTANNRGRKFFSCQSRECNFFIWEDTLNGGERTNTSASTSSRRGGRGQGGPNTSGVSFVSATGEPITGRCFICGDPGHFANVCPRRG